MRGSCCIYGGNWDALKVRLPIREIPICGELTLSPTVTVTENIDVIFFYTIRVHSARLATAVPSFCNHMVSIWRIQANL